MWQKGGKRRRNEWQRLKNNGTGGRKMAEVAKRSGRVAEKYQGMQKSGREATERWQKNGREQQRGDGEVAEKRQRWLKWT